MDSVPTTRSTDTTDGSHPALLGAKRVLLERENEVTERIDELEDRLDDLMVERGELGRAAVAIENLVDEIDK